MLSFQIGNTLNKKISLKTKINRGLCDIIQLFKQVWRYQKSNQERKSKIDKQYNDQEKQDKYNKTVIMLNICAQSICLEARQSGLYQIALQNSSEQQWAYENT